jgi:hypothetical protein
MRHCTAMDEGSAHPAPKPGNTGHSVQDSSARGEGMDGLLQEGHMTYHYSSVPAALGVAALNQSSSSPPSANIDSEGNRNDEKSGLAARRVRRQETQFRQQPKTSASKASRNDDTEDPPRRRRRYHDSFSDEGDYSASSDYSSSEDEDMIPGAFLVSTEGRAAAPVKANLTPAPELEEAQALCSSTDAQALRSSTDWVQSGGRRSSIAQKSISRMFAGDASVLTPGKIQEEENGDFRKEVWAVICCVILIIIIGVTVGVSYEVTAAPSPTAAPTTSPTISSESDRVVTLKSVLKHLSSDPSVLEDTTTPQYGALVWLADLDEAAIDLEDTNRLEVRYALAALYFATNGDNWFQNLGFLSPTHECDWFVELDQGENSTTVAEGVSCNDEDEVLAIKLGRL